MMLSTTGVLIIVLLVSASVGILTWLFPPSTQDTQGRKNL